MTENPLPISILNDFIFCPVSIYFHSLEQDMEKLISQDTFQINGTAAHRAVDNKIYSSKASILQSAFIYSEKYNLYGKIDIFDSESGILTERKKKISTVYDGYVFQLYAQYFALTEMQYSVNTLRLYSMDDNKIYPIELPSENGLMLRKFEQTVIDINSFDMDCFHQTNLLKCTRCIYEPLCSFSAIKE